jgi:hypothetical protein
MKRLRICIEVANERLAYLVGCAGLLATIWLISLIAGCKAAPAVVRDLPNKQVVVAGWLRSGQPTKAGYDWCKANGYTNIFEFNTFGERGALDGYPESIGLNVYHYPIPLSEQIFGEPSQALLHEIVDQIWSKPGTLFHCGSTARTMAGGPDSTIGGNDRTGLFGALIRFWKQGWTRQAALDEMLALGFHPFEVGLANAFDTATLGP